MILHAIILSASLAQPAQTHADCFTKKPNGTIVLYSCKQKSAPKKAPKAVPQKRKILVVPTGRELEI